ncbi:hypothetical protein VP395_04355 [Mariniflexile soesokkakense]|uniref:Uncharacterized protein n=1 Tax=Mariniflexile soesokkakense TaxID=1343160 RepID=A0ABV0A7E0_9FLAO
MKTKMRTLLLIPFFALLLFTSCQDEVIDITEPTQEEALVAASELTSMISATSKMDGSVDNIIDRASCLFVELPVTVKVNGKEVIIDSKEDYKTIEAIYNEFEDDDDKLEIVFPITIVLANHDEVVIQNRDALENLVKECKGENEEDDDIECIDFQYPISFSVYNAQFQVVNVVTIENDRQLHRFIKRVINAEVFASLNFPVTMVLADGTTVTVNNNAELAATIKEAKNACNEDDNNDYHDDDFTKERLDTLLKTCPWVVHEFQRNASSLSDSYREYLIVFKDDNVVKVRTRKGDMLTGKWTTRVTNRGALIKLEFDTLVDFTLEWFVYDLEPGRIKLYQAGGNKIILKKNCDVVVDITKERIENYLQECYWRIARLSINGADNEKDYIGTPLKFLPNNEVKLRINGEFVTGTYEVGVRNIGFILRITLDGRPDLKLEWLITFLEPGLIKLENANNKMVLERHCLDADDDLKHIDVILINGKWEVAKYDDGLVHVVDPTEQFKNYTMNFMINGRVEVTNTVDPNTTPYNKLILGSWLTYRNNGLYLGLYFKDQTPFNELNFRWKIVNVSANRIELKDLSSTGNAERILVLEKKN